MRRAAVVAGAALLAMTVLAGVSFAVLNSLVVAGDAAQTARNIRGDELLFRASACGFTAVAVLDVVVAWGLYGLLAPVDRGLATIAAWLRVGYAAAFLTAQGNLLAAANTPAGGDPGDVSAAVTAFQHGWDVALVMFGAHLFAVGWLVLRSGYVPAPIGVLLMIAALGYLVDSFGKLLVAGYDAEVAGFTFLGEVLLMAWLLWRGRRL
ncbi:DUF4386 domain-containing protein [Dactylosporangium fulvum]